MGRVALGWILFGFVVGLIARALTPGREPLGLIGSAILGIVGALLGGWIGVAAGWYSLEDSGGFIAATVGAVLILGIYHFFRHFFRHRRARRAAERLERKKAA